MFQRIAIIGPTNAGKSTLARQITAVLHLPVHHLDKLFWLPGMLQVPEDERLRIHDRLIRAEAWIIDGGYADDRQRSIERADLVILMSLPRWTLMWRYINRVWKYHGETRPDMGGGNHERLNWFMVKGIMNHKGPQKRIDWIRREFPKKPLVVIRSRADAERFVRSLRA